MPPPPGAQPFNKSQQQPATPPANQQNTPNQGQQAATPRQPGFPNALQSQTGQPQNQNTNQAQQPAQSPQTTPAAQPPGLLRRLATIARNVAIGPAKQKVNPVTQEALQEMQKREHANAVRAERQRLEQGGAIRYEKNRTLGERASDNWANYKRVYGGKGLIGALQYITDLHALTRAKAISSGARSNKSQFYITPAQQQRIQAFHGIHINPYSNLIHYPGQNDEDIDTQQAQQVSANAPGPMNRQQPNPPQAGGNP